MKTPLRIANFLVLVPVDATPDVEPSTCLDQKMLARALADLLALELGRERSDGDQHLVRRARELHLLVVEVVEHMNPVLDQVLENQPGPMHVAPESGFIAQHDCIESARFGGVQHRDQPRPPFEFGTTDSVIAVDVLARDAPAFPFDV
ncbi:MAG TPA: hypothetical protein VHC69_26260 [Polyangiaceae bacterium]|nr:hypothetical protein [Polyangiaceae bacterium]